MDAIAFIFARGGSKGLPGKNIRPLCGKPLIAWAIEQALSVSRISRVIVSTDSSDIAAVAREWGAETPFLRPEELASDDSPEWLSWRHALNYLHTSEGILPKIFVSIPTTAPLRLPVDIERCLDLYEEGGADMVIAISESHRNPYFNMVERQTDGSVSVVIPQKETLSRRQVAPRVYDMTTVAYVTSPSFVFRETNIFAGDVKAIQVPVERGLDIDSLLDFEIAEYLMTRSATI